MLLSVVIDCPSFGQWRSFNMIPPLSDTSLRSEKRVLAFHIARRVAGTMVVVMGESPVSGIGHFWCILSPSLTLPAHTPKEQMPTEGMAQLCWKSSRKLSVVAQSQGEWGRDAYKEVRGYLEKIGSLLRPGILSSDILELQKATLAGQKRAQDLVMDGYKPPYGCWELNSGPLEKNSQCP
ncbi:hypothetical protein STEG23_000782 [Scotinomys teguina]